MPKALEGDALAAQQTTTPSWEIKQGKQIHKVFQFPDFKTALDFVNQVGALAEEMNHHPDVLLTWGKVEITLSTHSANGLTVNDFALAAAIDRSTPDHVT